MADSVISFGQCPVCQGGQCRVRICQAGSKTLPIVLCDECEAYWPTPDLSQTASFLEAETGRVGDSEYYAWGPAGHWATSEEISRIDWQHPPHALTTTLVMPECDSALPSDISFLGGFSSITITGPNFEGDELVLPPPTDNLPPSTDLEG